MGSGRQSWRQDKGETGKGAVGKEVSLHKHLCMSPSSLPQWALHLKWLPNRGHRRPGTPGSLALY